MFLQYVYAAIAGLLVFAGMFVGIPMLVNNEKFKKVKGFFGIAADMVLAIEQEFGILERLEGETDEEYQARKDAFNAKKKAACLEAVIETLVAFKLPVPSEEVIDKAIEYGVKAMNLFLKKDEEEKKQ
jgi:hypothetical protein